MRGKNVYYQIKPFLPERLQVELRRIITKFKAAQFSDIWPIDETAKKEPEYWKGWPGEKKFSLVLTHDVETKIGHDKCYHLAELEKENGFMSSFNFVPERYGVSSELRNNLNKDGFEVGVHGLYHDGKLYRTREIFAQRSIRINKYLRDWQAVGFRSPAMHHNLEWLHDLNILYDASTFDTDPFEPQPDGMKTIFPFIVKNSFKNSSYIELPYTLPQDSTLFVFMKQKNIETWVKKLDWVAQHGGMALVITHPDYMNFNGKKLGIKEYPGQYYIDFLKHIKSRYRGQYWHALPKQMAGFWKKRGEY